MNTLKSVRTAVGLKQSDMAEKLDICQATYSNYESGRTTIPAEHALEIAEILGVDFDKFFLPKNFTVCNNYLQGITNGKYCRT